MKKSFFWLLTFCWAGAVCAQPALYDLERVVDIRLYFETPDWADRLDSLKDARQDERLRGAVEVDGVRYEGVGVRYKGNSSFHNVRKQAEKKLPFNIKLDYEDETQCLPGGYTTLKLANVFRDPSFLREVLSYEVAGRYMPAPQANFVRLYVNDEYLGFYNSSESVDKSFLSAHFGHAGGILFKCDPDWRHRRPAACPEGDRASLQYLGEDTLCYMGLYELKSDTGWTELVTLTRVLDRAPDSLESVLDVDQVLWMLAFNNALVNLDSYNGMLCHNYYLYRDTFGQFHPIVWDMNLSFGGFRHIADGQAYDNRGLPELSPFHHFRNEKRPLIRKLLANRFYRKIYLAHLRTIYDDFLSGDALAKRARAVQGMIAPHVEEDAHKLYSYDAFETNLEETTIVDGDSIIGLLELLEKRGAYLGEHPLFQRAAPVIDEVEHASTGNDIQVRARIHGADKVWLYHRCAGNGNFRRLEMTSAESDQAIDWTARLPRLEGTQYYIVAEGEKAAALSPERASHQFYQVE